MKKVQTKHHRQKSIGNGSRAVAASAKPRKKKKSIVSNTRTVPQSVSTSSAGKRSGCSGCSRSSGKK